MNRNDHDHERNQSDDQGGTLPDSLRLALRGLRRDIAPTHDLFPGIAARLADATSTPATAMPTAAAPSHARHARHSRRQRAPAWMAVAAVLALAVGVTWQLRPASDLAPGEATTAAAPDVSHAPIVQEADRMAGVYRQAWNALDAQRRPDVDASALHQLDASAAEVRAALQQDPDARFLFDRLQSLYARRLDLAQRLAYPTT